MFFPPVHFVGVVQAGECFSVESLEGTAHDGTAVFETLAHFTNVDFRRTGYIEPRVQGAREHAYQQRTLELYRCKIGIIKYCKISLLQL